MNNSRDIESLIIGEKHFIEKNEQKSILLRNKTYLYSCNFVEPGKKYEFKKYIKNIDIKCKIINNGKTQWIKEKTILKLQTNENYGCDLIKLNPLNKDEQEEITIFLKVKKKLEKGEYILKFDLFVDDIPYGDPIEIIIKTI